MPRHGRTRPWAHRPRKAPSAELPCAGSVCRGLWDPAASLTVPGRAHMLNWQCSERLGERALQTCRTQGPEPRKRKSLPCPLPALDSGAPLAGRRPASFAFPLLSPAYTSPWASAPVRGPSSHSLKVFPQPDPRPTRCAPSGCPALASAGVTFFKGGAPRAAVGPFAGFRAPRTCFPSRLRLSSHVRDRTPAQLSPEQVLTFKHSQLAPL